jgi:hypothetical protein
MIFNAYYDLFGFVFECSYRLNLRLIQKNFLKIPPNLKLFVKESEIQASNIFLVKSFNSAIFLLLCYQLLGYILLIFVLILMFCFLLI